MQLIFIKTGINKFKQAFEHWLTVSAAKNKIHINMQSGPSPTGCLLFVTKYRQYSVLRQVLTTSKILLRHTTRLLKASVFTASFKQQVLTNILFSCTVQMFYSMHATTLTTEWVILKYLIFSSINAMFWPCKRYTFSLVM